MESINEQIKMQEKFNLQIKLVELEKLVTNLNIKYVQIKNPDNPAQLKNAKLITFIKESKR